MEGMESMEGMYDGEVDATGTERLERRRLGPVFRDFRDPELRRDLDDTVLRLEVLLLRLVFAMRAPFLCYSV